LSPATAPPENQAGQQHRLIHSADSTCGKGGCLAVQAILAAHCPNVPQKGTGEAQPIERWGFVLRYQRSLVVTRPSASSPAGRSCDPPVRDRAPTGAARRIRAGIHVAILHQFGLGVSVELDIVHAWHGQQDFANGAACVGRNKPRGARLDPLADLEQYRCHRATPVYGKQP
jgi:hypothetical protein